MKIDERMKYYSGAQIAKLFTRKMVLELIGEPDFIARSAVSENTINWKFYERERIDEIMKSEEYKEARRQADQHAKNVKRGFQRTITHKELLKQAEILREEGKYEAAREIKKLVLFNDPENEKAKKD